MARDYDVLVIGGGAAGLTAAGLSAGLGARTLLVEKARLGGDCTWTGCVPSKALLHAAKIAQQARKSDDVGISIGSMEIDFAAVMRHLRRTRDVIYSASDAPEVVESMGVEVRHAACTFVNAHTVEFDDGTCVDARYVIIAAGSSPVLPPIDGIDRPGIYTTETIFEIEERPERLLVIGTGPVGIEMAQAFRRLGSEVDVVDAGGRILPDDDAEPAAVLKGLLEREGVNFHLRSQVRSIRSRGGTIVLELEAGQSVVGDALLVAGGRRPNTDGLGLSAAGVDYDLNGIRVDSRCRTSVSHIYAAGDVTGGYDFTHTAEHMARTAVLNALLKIPRTLDAGHIPWVTYTDPELAHVGPTELQLTARGSRFEVCRFPYEELDRAVIDGESAGMITIYARPRTGRILGATILGARAGEMISEIAVAMRHGITLRKISDTIHPYPTYGLGVRRAADQWYVRRRRAGLVRALQTIFRYRGTVREYRPSDVV